MAADTSMGDVVAALKVVWDASPELADLNGPYRDEAPPTPASTRTRPYCVVRTYRSNRIRRTNQSEHWLIPVEFVVYADTTVQADSWIAKIGGAFDPAQLVLPDGKGWVLSLDRIGEMEAQPQDRTTAIASITYEAVRQKLRTDIG